MARILAVALNPTIDVSCQADKIQPTLKVRTHEQHQNAGGGGTNVARVIAMLGGKPELAYLAGANAGDLYETLLNDERIQVHRFSIEGDMRIALAVHETETGLEYRFVPEGPNIREEELNRVMQFIKKSDSDYIVASGSLPNGVPEDSYARMAHFTAEQNARFILDTSGEALRITLDHARLFLIKPSLRELETYAGRTLDEKDISLVASDIVARGAAEHVVVSMGQEGALLANADGVLRVQSAHVKTESAVGAGDSFVGAMTWRIAQGNPIEDAFRFGVAAGAAAAMTPGTELCRKSDVLEIFEASGGKI